MSTNSQTPTAAASERFVAGKRFRVIKDGAELVGMRPRSEDRSCFESWRKQLRVGEVIESLGYGAGFGTDPGFGIHFKTDEPDVVSVEFQPNGSGTWSTYWPQDGWLEEVEAQPEPRPTGGQA